MEARIHQQSGVNAPIQEDAQAGAISSSKVRAPTMTTTQGVSLANAPVSETQPKDMPVDQHSITPAQSSLFHSIFPQTSNYPTISVLLSEDLQGYDAKSCLRLLKSKKEFLESMLANPESHSKIEEEVDLMFTFGRRFLDQGDKSSWAELRKIYNELRLSIEKYVEQPTPFFDALKELLQGVCLSHESPVEALEQLKLSLSHQESAEGHYWIGVLSFLDNPDVALLSMRTAHNMGILQAKKFQDYLDKESLEKWWDENSEGDGDQSGSVQGVEFPEKRTLTEDKWRVYELRAVSLARSGLHIGMFRLYDGLLHGLNGLPKGQEIGLFYLEQAVQSGCPLATIYKASMIGGFFKDLSWRVRYARSCEALDLMEKSMKLRLHLEQARKLSAAEKSLLGQDSLFWHEIIPLKLMLQSAMLHSHNNNDGLALALMKIFCIGLGDATSQGLIDLQERDNCERHFWMGSLAYLDGRDEIGMERSRLSALMSHNQSYRGASALLARLWMKTPDNPASMGIARIRLSSPVLKFEGDTESEPWLFRTKARFFSLQGMLHEARSALCYCDIAAPLADPEEAFLRQSLELICGMERRKEPEILRYSYRQRIFDWREQLKDQSFDTHAVRAHSKGLCTPEVLLMSLASEKDGYASEHMEQLAHCDPENDLRGCFRMLDLLGNDLIRVAPQYSPGRLLAALCNNLTDEEAIQYHSDPGRDAVVFLLRQLINARKDSPKIKRSALRCVALLTRSMSDYHAYVIELKRQGHFESAMIIVSKAIKEAHDRYIYRRMPLENLMLPADSKSGDCPLQTASTCKASDLNFEEDGVSLGMLMAQEGILRRMMPAYKVPAPQLTPLSEMRDAIRGLQVTDVTSRAQSTRILQKLRPFVPLMNDFDREITREEGQKEAPFDSPRWDVERCLTLLGQAAHNLGHHSEAAEYILLASGQGYKPANYLSAIYSYYLRDFKLAATLFEESREQACTPEQKKILNNWIADSRYYGILNNPWLMNETQGFNWDDYNPLKKNADELVTFKDGNGYANLAARLSGYLIHADHDSSKMELQPIANELKSLMHKAEVNHSTLVLESLYQQLIFPKPQLIPINPRRVLEALRHLKIPDSPVDDQDLYPTLHENQSLSRPKKGIRGSCVSRYFSYMVLHAPAELTALRHTLICSGKLSYQDNSVELKLSTGVKILSSGLGKLCSETGKRLNAVPAHEWLGILKDDKLKAVLSLLLAQMYVQGDWPKKKYAEDVLNWLQAAAAQGFACAHTTQGQLLRQFGQKEAALRSYARGALTSETQAPDDEAAYLAGLVALSFGKARWGCVLLAQAARSDYPQALCLQYELMKQKVPGFEEYSLPDLDQAWLNNFPLVNYLRAEEAWTKQVSLENTPTLMQFSKSQDVDVLFYLLAHMQKHPGSFTFQNIQVVIQQLAKVMSRENSWRFLDHPRMPLVAVALRKSRINGVVHLCYLLRAEDHWTEETRAAETLQSGCFKAPCISKSSAAAAMLEKWQKKKGSLGVEWCREFRQVCAHEKFELTETLCAEVLDALLAMEAGKVGGRALCDESIAWMRLVETRQPLDALPVSQLLLVEALKDCISTKAHSPCRWACALLRHISNKPKLPMGEGLKKLIMALLKVTRKTNPEEKELWNSVFIYARQSGLKLNEIISVGGLIAVMRQEAFKKGIADDIAALVEMRLSSGQLSAPEIHSLKVNMISWYESQGAFNKKLKWLCLLGDKDTQQSLQADLLLEFSQLMDQPVCNEEQVRRVCQSEVLSKEVVIPESFTGDKLLTLLTRCKTLSRESVHDALLNQLAKACCERLLQEKNRISVMRYMCIQSYIQEGEAHQQIQSQFGQLIESACTLPSDAGYITTFLHRFSRVRTEHEPFGRCVLRLCEKLSPYQPNDVQDILSYFKPSCDALKKTWKEVNLKACEVAEGQRQIDEGIFGLESQVQKCHRRLVSEDSLDVELKYQVRVLNARLKIQCNKGSDQARAAQKLLAEGVQTVQLRKLLASYQEQNALTPGKRAKLQKISEAVRAHFTDKERAQLQALANGEQLLDVVPVPELNQGKEPEQQSPDSLARSQPEIDPSVLQGEHDLVRAPSAAALSTETPSTETSSPDVSSSVASSSGSSISGSLKFDCVEVPADVPGQNEVVLSDISLSPEHDQSIALSLHLADAEELLEPAAMVPQTLSAETIPLPLSCDSDWGSDSGPDQHSVADEVDELDSAVASAAKNAESADRVESTVNSDGDVRSSDFSNKSVSECSEHTSGSEVSFPSVDLVPPLRIEMPDDSYDMAASRSTSVSTMAEPASSESTGKRISLTIETSASSLRGIDERSTGSESPESNSSRSEKAESSNEFAELDLDYPKLAAPWVDAIKEMLQQPTETFNDNACDEQFALMNYYLPDYNRHYPNLRVAFYKKCLDKAVLKRDMKSVVQFTEQLQSISMAKLCALPQSSRKELNSSVLKAYQAVNKQLGLNSSVTQALAALYEGLFTKQSPKPFCTIKQIKAKAKARALQKEQVLKKKTTSPAKESALIRDYLCNPDVLGNAQLFPQMLPSLQQEINSLSTTNEQVEVLSYHLLMVLVDTLLYLTHVNAMGYQTDAAFERRMEAVKIANDEICYAMTMKTGQVQSGAPVTTFYMSQLPAECNPTLCAIKNWVDAVVNQLSPAATWDIRNPWMRLQNILKQVHARAEGRAIFQQPAPGVEFTHTAQIGKKSVYPRAGRVD